LREAVDSSRLKAFMERLGRKVRGPGTVFVTGGGTAVLKGWRASTVHIDISFDPEPAGAFEAIRDLKRSLDVNVELAAPADLVPRLPGWRHRSESIARHGKVDFLHYDHYSQTLSRIERDHVKDRLDVDRMVADGLVDPGALARLFAGIEGELIRYPLADRVAAFVARHSPETGP